MNIKFDNYDIDLDALNRDLAESSSSYLDSKRWAKDPEARARWNLAYNDINSRGITGFSTSNGRYTLSHNGVAFEDPDGYYADAANFIISRAKNILDTSKAKEKEEKKELENYGSFAPRLSTHILNRNYGGDSTLMDQSWRSLDKKDEYGLYETTKRKEALKKALQDYKATLEDNKYSFGGTSYNDLNDLKSKIDAAITSLNDPNNTDYTALHLLGINENVWFPTNEEAATEARTAAEKKLAAENKAKQAQEVALANQKRANQYKNYRIINMSRLNGTPPSGQGVEARLSGYASLPKLNGLQLSELIGAFKYALKKGLLLNLDKDELSKFGDMYANNPTRLKKVKGINGFYYDSIGNRIIQPFQGTAPLLSLLDVVDENSPEAIAQRKEEENLRLRALDAQRTEINENDVLYLSSLIPDIASLFDEEPISAGALGVSAAGMRNAALANRPGGMSLEDKLWLGLDYLGGAFSAVPFFGDAYVLGRILNTARKGATALLGMAGVVGVSSDVYNLIKKFNNDETLTAREKIALASSIPLIINAYRSGRAWKQNKAIKAVNEGEKTRQGTIEATNGSIKGIKEETAKALQKEFKKAGNDNAKKLEILKNNEEIVKLAKEQNVKIEDLQFESYLRNGKYSPIKKLQDIKIEETSTGNPVYRLNYQQYLRELENGNFWQRNRARGLKEANWFYNKTGGSRNNSAEEGWFKKIWNDTFGSNKVYDKITESNTKTPKPKEEIDESKLISVDSNKETSPYAKRPLDTNPTIMNTKSFPEPVSYNRETMSRYNDAINGRFGKESLLSGNVKVGGNGDLKVVQQTDGTYNIYFKGNLIGNERNQVEIQRIISSVIKQLNKKDSQIGKVSAKEMGEILRNLKAKGWLRHGGKLIKA